MAKNEKTQILWHGKAFNFSREEIILPDGKHTVIEAIRHPGSSAVVPVLENESVVLIRLPTCNKGFYMGDSVRDDASRRGPSGVREEGTP
jgi:hypothetical protein